jgi:capsid protein
MRQFARSLLAAMVALAPISISTPSMSADALYAPSDYSSACANNGVLGRIQSRFRYQVTHVPHLPDVSILEFHNIQENRYEPAQEEWPIARRYCEATVVLSDGSQRNAWYLIEERMGFATLAAGFGLANETHGSNVEFCVSGFDRWFVYNGACRVLR